MHSDDIDETEYEDLGKYLDDTFESGTTSRHPLRYAEAPATGALRADATDPTSSLSREESHWARARELELTLEHTILEKDALQSQIDALQIKQREAALKAQSEALDRDIRIAELEQQLALQSGGESQKSDVRVSELQTAFETLQGWHVQAVSDLAALNSQYQHVTKQIGGLQEELAETSQAYTEAQETMRKLNEALTLDSQLIEEYNLIQNQLKEALDVSDAQTEALKIAFNRLVEKSARDVAEMGANCQTLIRENENLRKEIAEASKFLIPQWKQVLEQKREAAVPSAGSRRPSTLQSVIGLALRDLTDRISVLLSENAKETATVSFHQISSLINWTYWSGRILIKLQALASHITGNYTTSFVEAATANPLSLLKDKGTIRWIASLYKMMGDACFWICFFAWTVANTRKNDSFAQFLERKVVLERADGGKIETNLLKATQEYDILLESVVTVCALEDMSGSLDISGLELYPQVAEQVVQALFKRAENRELLAKALSWRHRNPPISVVSITTHRCLMSLLSVICGVAETSFSEKASSEVPTDTISPLTTSLQHIFNLAQNPESGLGSAVVMAEKFPAALTWTRETDEIDVASETSFTAMTQVSAWAEEMSIALSPYKSGSTSAPSWSLAGQQFALNPQLEIQAASTGESGLHLFTNSWGQIATAQKLVNTLVTNIKSRVSFKEEDLLPSFFTQSIERIPLPIQLMPPAGPTASDLLAESEAAEVEDSQKQTSLDETARQKIEISSLQAKLQALNNKLAALEVERSDYKEMAKQRDAFVTCIEEKTKTANMIGSQLEILKDKYERTLKDLTTKSKKLEELESRQSEESRVPPQWAQQENVYLRTIIDKLQHELTETRLRQAKMEWNELCLENESFETRYRKCREQIRDTSNSISEICDIRTNMLKQALRLPAVIQTDGAASTRLHDYAKEANKWRQSQVLNVAKLKLINDNLMKRAEHNFLSTTDPWHTKDPQPVVETGGFYGHALINRIKEKDAEWTAVCSLKCSDSKKPSSGDNKWSLYLPSYDAFMDFSRKINVPGGLLEI